MGSIVCGAVKVCIFNSRILWSFTSALRPPRLRHAPANGWINGVFCLKSKSASVNDLPAAMAAVIVRTRECKTRECPPSLRPLHPRRSSTTRCRPRSFGDGS